MIQSLKKQTGKQGETSLSSSFDSLLRLTDSSILVKGESRNHPIDKEKTQFFQKALTSTLTNGEYKAYLHNKTLQSSVFLAENILVDSQNDEKQISVKSSKTLEMSDLQNNTEISSLEYSIKEKKSNLAAEETFKLQELEVHKQTEQPVLVMHQKDEAEESKAVNPKKMLDKGKNDHKQQLGMKQKELTNTSAEKDYLQAEFSLNKLNESTPNFIAKSEVYRLAIDSIVEQQLEQDEAEIPIQKVILMEKIDVKQPEANENSSQQQTGLERESVVLKHPIQKLANPTENLIQNDFAQLDFFVNEPQKKENQMYQSNGVEPPKLNKAVSEEKLLERLMPKGDTQLEFSKVQTEEIHHELIKTSEEPHRVKGLAVDHYLKQKLSEQMEVPIQKEVFQKEAVIGQPEAKGFSTHGQIDVEQAELHQTEWFEEDLLKKLISTIDQELVSPKDQTNVIHSEKMTTSKEQQLEKKPIVRNQFEQPLSEQKEIPFSQKINQEKIVVKQPETKEKQNHHQIMIEPLEGKLRQPMASELLEQLVSKNSTHLENPKEQTKFVHPISNERSELNLLEKSTMIDDLQQQMLDQETNATILKANINEAIGNQPEAKEGMNLLQSVFEQHVGDLRRQNNPELPEIQVQKEAVQKEISKYQTNEALKHLKEAIKPLEQNQQKQSESELLVRQVPKNGKLPKMVEQQRAIEIPKQPKPINELLNGDQHQHQHFESELSGKHVPKNNKQSKIIKQHIHEISTQQETINESQKGNQHQQFELELPDQQVRQNEKQLKRTEDHIHDIPKQPKIVNESLKENHHQQMESQLPTHQVSKNEKLPKMAERKQSLETMKTQYPLFESLEGGQIYHKGKQGRPTGETLEQVLNNITQLEIPETQTKDIRFEANKREKSQTIKNHSIVNAKQGQPFVKEQEFHLRTDSIMDEALDNEHKLSEKTKLNTRPETQKEPANRSEISVANKNQNEGLNRDFSSKPNNPIIPNITKIEDNDQNQDTTSFIVHPQRGTKLVDENPIQNNRNRHEIHQAQANNQDSSRNRNPLDAHTSSQEFSHNSKNRQTEVFPKQVAVKGLSMNQPPQPQLSSIDNKTKPNQPQAEQQKESNAQLQSLEQFEANQHSRKNPAVKQSEHIPEQQTMISQPYRERKMVSKTKRTTRAEKQQPVDIPDIELFEKMVNDKNLASQPKNKIVQDFQRFGNAFLTNQPHNQHEIIHTAENLEMENSYKQQNQAENYQEKVQVDTNLVKNDEGNLIHSFPFQQSPIIETPIINKPIMIRSAHVVQDVSNFLQSTMKIQNMDQGIEAVFTLAPEHLGKVEVKVSIVDGRLNAEFLTNTSSGKELLESNIQTLRVAIEAQGLTVDKINIAQQNSTTSFMGTFSQKNDSNSRQSQSDSRKRNERLVQDHQKDYRETGYDSIQESQINTTA